MSGTEVAPHPSYAVPITLRQALASGVDLTIDVDLVAGLVAGRFDADEVKRREVLHRHEVACALQGDPRYCVEFTMEDGVECRWPTQKVLQTDQWSADLLSEPANLLSSVLAWLSPEQRADVDALVAGWSQEGEF